MRRSPFSLEAEAGIGTLGAWAVHVFTASGVAWGFLALLAISRQQWMAALAWMGLAMLVDAADGTLARRLRVAQALPGFDGALLDNITDYFTYAVVPAWFVFQAGLLPPAAALAGALVILLTSAYQFAQADARTDDHFFKGFPSYWNVVAFYFFVLGANPWLNLALLLGLSLVVFVPIKYVYHARTAAYRRLTLALSLVWAGMVVAIGARHPEVPQWLVGGSLLYVLYYAGISLYLTARPSPSPLEVPLEANPADQ